VHCAARARFGRGGGGSHGMQMIYASDESVTTALSKTTA
jgi:hypothetical protein